MRVLAACSLGGAGHLHPLVPFLDAAQRRGHETTVIAPASMREMVESTGHRFVAGAEPPEAEVGPIREQLPVASAQVASVLGNRDLFGRLATTAMLPAMEQVVSDWEPDFVVRDPCEYASAVVAGRRSIPTAQMAISLADAELGSLITAAPALEAHRPGLVEELRASPYLTRFPTALDPSPFATTLRFRDTEPSAAAPLPDWWDEPDAPLVYVTFGTVLGHMSMAADVYRTALRAVADLPVRVLLTLGRQTDPTSIGPVPAHVHVEAWVDQRRVFGSGRSRRVPRRVGHRVRRARRGHPDGRRAHVLGPVRERAADRGGRSRPDRRAGALGDRPRRSAPGSRRPRLRAGARRVRAEMASNPDIDELVTTLLG